MNKLRYFVLAALCVLPVLLSAQEVSVNEARFHVGDSPDWAAPAFDDSAWQVLTLDKEWDYQGVSTPDEQYTHISIWSLLASNMLIGCDIAQIDDFTFNLLCNNEVNAVNQDVLGKQAHQDVDEDGMQIWSRPLSDGGVAVGIFNMNEQPVPVLLSGALAKIGLKAEKARDLWRQQDIPTDETYIIPAHGVRYVKVGWGCEC